MGGVRRGDGEALLVLVDRHAHRASDLGHLEPEVLGKGDVSRRREHVDVPRAEHDLGGAVEGGGVEDVGGRGEGLGEVPGEAVDHRAPVLARPYGKVDVDARVLVAIGLERAGEPDAQVGEARAAELLAEAVDRRLRDGRAPGELLGALAEAALGTCEDDVGERALGLGEAVALEAQPGEDVHVRPYSAGAGGSPVERTSSRAASSSTGTPRLSALASLDPAASPATT